MKIQSSNNNNSFYQLKASIIRQEDRIAILHDYLTMNDDSPGSRVLPLVVVRIQGTAPTEIDQVTIERIPSLIRYRRDGQT